ncbi:MAG: hypothetical protein LBG95_10040 [Treponema sp.]|jgi:hypothetical protein|nr:hypothetical protein [Treponema sp.]
MIILFSNNTENTIKNNIIPVRIILLTEEIKNAKIRKTGNNSNIFGKLNITKTFDKIPACKKCKSIAPKILAK